MYSRCVIKVVEGFSVIGNLAVVTCITVNYARVIFFSSDYLIRNRVLSFTLRSKKYFQFTTW